MDTFERIVGILSGAAALAAVVVALLAAWTYRDLRPSAELRRRQHEYYIRLSAEILLILEALHTFGDSIKRNEPPDPYLFPIYRHNTIQLHEILNDSADHEVTHEIVGSHENRWQRHLAFRSGLREQSKLKLGRNSHVLPVVRVLQPVFGCHFVLGLMELTTVCIGHEDNPLGGDLKRSLRRAETDWVRLLADCRDRTDGLWM